MTGPAGRFDATAVAVLLCDADGNLFPSEEHAFVPSTALVNRFLAESGSGDRYEPEELRLSTTGKNFRTTLADVARERDIALPPEVLETWVGRERRDVTAHLSTVLRPDPSVRDPLRSLRRSFALAAVSSSASSRLDACFEATDLAELFPAEVRFSAEDSLPRPASKPDPAIYRHAGRQLGIDPPEGLAVEDSVPGVRSAVGAGFPTVGNVVFVPPAERAQRACELRECGAAAVICSWSELDALLGTANAGGGLASATC